RTTSGSSRSTSIRPSCASLAISHKTMAEMLQRRVRRSFSSAGLRLSPRAWSRMCVSRLSIPLGPGREDVTLDLQSALQRTDEGGRFRANRDQLGHGPAALRDHDAFIVDLVEDREALLLELRGCDLLHGRKIALVTSSVQSAPQP